MIANPSVSGTWSSVSIIVASLLIFELDRATGTAPVQHLYYLPTILAAHKFGQRGGLTAALAEGFKCGQDRLLRHLLDGREYPARKWQNPTTKVLR